MKKRIYGLIFACLLVTQQTKPFIEMAAFASAMGSAAFSFVQQSVMSAMMVALANKARGYNEEAPLIMKHIASLNAERSNTTDKLKQAVLTKQIVEEKKNLDSKLTLLHRISGILHPVVGAGMTALNAYSGLTAFAGFFGFGLPGAGSLFLNLMGGGQ